MATTARDVIVHPMPQRSPLSPSSQVRCAFCDALLATREAGALRIVRGDLEAVIDGTFRASLVCYRPRCRRLNVLSLPSGS